MINMKVSGIANLLTQLRTTAERVPAAARGQMHRSADRIVKEAQLNAPVDKHNLEQSIHKEVARESRDASGRGGRLKIDVVAGGFVNGVDVDEYAVRVHENYSDMGVGPGTLAKRQANPGRYIGEKFLERAALEEKKRLTNSVISVVQREIAAIWI